MRAGSNHRTWLAVRGVAVVGHVKAALLAEGVCEVVRLAQRVLACGAAAMNRSSYQRFADTSDGRRQEQRCELCNRSVAAAPVEQSAVAASIFANLGAAGAWSCAATVNAQSRPHRQPKSCVQNVPCVLHGA